jgi:hypothetical protein
MSCLTIIEGSTVIIHVDYSSIGYGYPRLFINFNEEAYVAIDATLGTAAIMSKVDYESWLPVDETLPAREATAKYGLNYDACVELIKEIKAYSNKEGDVNA